MDERIGYVKAALVSIVFVACVAQTVSDPSILSVGLAVCGGGWLILVIVQLKPWRREERKKGV